MPMKVNIESVGAYPGHFLTGPPNNAIVITLVAGRKRGRMAGTIVYSYSAAPTGGRLTMAGGGFGLDVDIVAGGPGVIPFHVPIHATDDANVVLTLSAGGAGIVGKLNIFGLSRD